MISVVLCCTVRGDSDPAVCSVSKYSFINDKTRVGAVVAKNVLFSFMTLRPGHHLLKASVGANLCIDISH